MLWNRSVERSVRALRVLIAVPILTFSISCSLFSDPGDYKVYFGNLARAL